MRRDNSPWGPTPPADIKWTDEGDPFSNRFDDVYYSREDGAAESRHVFLTGNDLPARWHDTQGPRFCIAETGFGTGLNFLLTWQAWLALPAPRPRLHYISIEKFPLGTDELARALAAWPALATQAEQLQSAWPGRLPGQHRVVFEDGELVLDLWWEDITNALPDMAAHGATVDAWYLDGFAPSRNDSMWQPALYQAIAALSRPNASFATFTAAGHVRRGLISAGFAVDKVPGFGRKRECLRGKLDDTTAMPEPPKETPWDLPATPRTCPDSVLVIGAGLAGSTVAAALARRGVAVTVLDAGAIAGAASGNDQGILYTRLSRRHSSLTDFALQSFRFASTLYRQMFSEDILVKERDGELCGSYHQQTNEEELALMRERLNGLEELGEVLTPTQAYDYLGEQPSIAGYWFPDSGWLRPPAVCQALLRHDLITVQEHCGSLSLAHSEGAWQAVAAGETVAKASSAIICTGVNAAGFAGLEWLPLQAIRGQTSHIPASTESLRLKAGFCHKGYISPARNGMHCMGATFTLRDSGTELRAQDHRHNLERLATAIPSWREGLEQLDVTKLDGRVGFRCASPDYLPIAGPVPDRNQFLQTYGGLRKNARHSIPLRGPYVPGLYVNTAHGSRGLSSAPLVAEWLASDICCEPRPLSRELSRALSPARFLIRDLSRNRI